MTAALYERFRSTLEATSDTGRIMAYRWSSLPDSVSVQWLPYALMLEEFSRGLANVINDLTHHEKSLRAWAVVVALLSDEEKLEANHEFIDVLGTVALSLPYVIRARFAFAVAHLSHQANQLKIPEWKDNLPLDMELNLGHAGEFGRLWKTYNRLKLSLEKISGKDYIVGTHNFRNVYTHRLEPRLVIGFSQTVTRSIHGGRVSYGIGAQPPLELGDVASLLATQRGHCYRAFEAFQALVREQEAAIVAAPL